MPFSDLCVFALCVLREPQYLVVTLGGRNSSRKDAEGQRGKDAKMNAAKVGVLFRRLLDSYPRILCVFAPRCVFASLLPELLTPLSLLFGVASFRFGLQNHNQFFKLNRQWSLELQWLIRSGMMKSQLLGVKEMPAEFTDFSF